MQPEISLSFQPTKDGWKLNGSETPTAMSARKNGDDANLHICAKEQKRDTGKNNGKKSVGPGDNASRFVDGSACFVPVSDVRVIVRVFIRIEILVRCRFNLWGFCGACFRRGFNAETRMIKCFQACNSFLFSGKWFFFFERLSYGWEIWIITLCICILDCRNV